MAQGKYTAEQLAFRAGVPLLVLPWTVNQPADMDRLIDWGVDGLISDRPDLVRKYAIRSTLRNYSTN